MIQQKILEKNCQLQELQTQRSSINGGEVENSARIKLVNEIGFMQEKYGKVMKKISEKKLGGQPILDEIEEMGNIMNAIAMKYSQEGKNSKAEELLREALKEGNISTRLRIITYNNLACVYKQTHNLGKALMYIGKAQKQADHLSVATKDDKLLSIMMDCNLNLSAILSAMNNHSNALKAVRKAIKLLTSNQSLSQSYYQCLYPIAKYNQGVELEKLKMLREAENSYLQVLTLAKNNEMLVGRVKEAIENIRQKIEIRQKKGLRYKYNMINCHSTNKYHEIGNEDGNSKIKKISVINLFKTNSGFSTARTCQVRKSPKQLSLVTSKLKLIKVGKQNWGCVASGQKKLINNLRFVRKC